MTETRRQQPDETLDDRSAQEQENDAPTVTPEDDDRLEDGYSEFEPESSGPVAPTPATARDEDAEDREKERERLS